jgi:putative lumazine-binding protein
VTTTDEQAIEATVRDYFEGWFDGDAERMERALHPQLAKRALRDGKLSESPAPEMIEATSEGIGKAQDPGERRIEIEVVDIHPPIAAAVVHSNVYREYVHLVRTESGWKIANALWEWDRERD